MKSIERMLKNKGIELNQPKLKDKVANINSAAKQKELLIKIATDLGYVE